MFADGWGKIKVMGEGEICTQGERILNKQK